MLRIWPATATHLDLLVEAVSQSGYRPGEQISLAVDVAASELAVASDGGEVSYELAGEGRSGLSAGDLIDLYEEWIESYPLISIEDGLAEDDRAGWRDLTARLGDRAQIVGDDVFVTNPEIVREGIRDHLANALLVKVNQIGTLTETFEAVELAKIAWLVEYH